jgi:hypothetical protein
MFKMAEDGEGHINDNNENLFANLWIFESQILLT